MPPAAAMSKAAIAIIIFFRFILFFLIGFNSKTAFVQITLPKKCDFLKKNKKEKQELAMSLV